MEEFNIFYKTVSLWKSGKLQKEETIVFQQK